MRRNNGGHTTSFSFRSSSRSLIKLMVRKMSVFEFVTVCRAPGVAFGGGDRSHLEDSVLQGTWILRHDNVHPIACAHDHTRL